MKSSTKSHTQFPVTHLAGKLDDFEDGVVSEAAHHIGARAIVTRNVKHYKGSAVPAYLPSEILEMLVASGKTT